MNLSRPWIAVVLGAALSSLGFAASMASAQVEIGGYASASVLRVDGDRSYRNGGFGRHILGRTGTDDGNGIKGGGDRSEEAIGQLQLTLTWQAERTFGAYLHLLARAEPNEVDGDAAGVVEALVEATVPLRTSDRFHVQLGHFLLPTSRENADVAWSSPYTQSFSAINTWIGEEVRVSGIGLDYTLALGERDELTAFAIGFGGNDAAGALLAWRGWSLHDRLTALGEVNPLPPVLSLVEEGAFAEQRNDGTRPFDRDLDGRIGYAASLRYRRPESFVVQYTYYDNQADRQLYGGEYAWATRFQLLGAEWHPGRHFDLVAEYLNGQTGMGNPLDVFVQLDAEAGYLLASVHSARWRLTSRWDEFSTVDLDRSDPDVNDDDGDALTISWSWQSLNRPLRIGFEWLSVDATRPAAELKGFSAATGSDTYLFDVRYYLDR